jgi:hypothetical protein
MPPLQLKYEKRHFFAININVNCNNNLEPTIFGEETIKAYFNKESVKKKQSIRTPCRSFFNYFEISLIN